MSETLEWPERPKLFLQNKRRILSVAVLLLASVAFASAQDQPAEPESSSHKTKIEPHVLEFNVEAGWALGLPDPHATLRSSDGSTATARLATTQLAPSAGVRFWANRWVGVSVDVLGSNPTESAELETAKATVHQRFLAVYFGAEAQRPRGPIQPYVHFGGGPLRISQQIGLSDGQSWMRVSQSTTAGSFRTGGGVRLMCSPRWGVKFGAEVLHYSANDIGAHTLGRVTLGFFFQARGRSSRQS